jgi:hypothetical protein
VSHQGLALTTFLKDSFIKVKLTYNKLLIFKLYNVYVLTYLWNYRHHLVPVNSFSFPSSFPSTDLFSVSL